DDLGAVHQLTAVAFDDVDGYRPFEVPTRPEVAGVRTPIARAAPVSPAAAPSPGITVPPRIPDHRSFGFTARDVNGQVGRAVGCLQSARLELACYGLAQTVLGERIVLVHDAVGAHGRVHLQSERLVATEVLLTVEGGDA